MIYVVFKAAKEQAGEFVFVSTERAFHAMEGAKAWVAAKGPVVFQEVVNGVTCDVERAIHEVEIE